MKHKISLLFALYFCQGLPGGFLAVALPVLLRAQGMSLTTVGFSAFLSAPWVLKVLWAPLVDRFGWKRFGRRKSWIVPSHLGVMAICLALAFFSPDRSLFAVALLFLVLNIFAATQDIGVDGLAVDILREDEMGPGNMAQISGFKLGNLFGGGVLLALSGYLGWRGDFFIMFACVAAAMVFLLLSDERRLAPRRQAAQVAAEPGRSVLRRLIAALGRQGLVFWFFLAYVKFGETLGGAMVKPMLFDKGLSLQMIGLLDGTVGAICTIAGGVLGGLLCRSRGWRFSLALFIAMQGLFLICLGLYSGLEINPVGAGILNGCENLAGGGVGVSVFALAMSLCDREVGASQFTVSQVVYMCGAYAAYPLSGRLADAVGYLPVMIAGGILAMTVSVIAWKMSPVIRRP
ncbi:MAG: MFS transporter [Deltaproteobacteria bacterium]|nr:MFS transporter [Deltaproteobacteria bacterium]